MTKCYPAGSSRPEYTAFDTVDQDIHMTRFEVSFGIDESVLKLFRSFLTDRTQAVSFQVIKRFYLHSFHSGMVYN